MDDTPPQVAVIVPVYNTPAAFLREALDSIAQQNIAGAHFLLRIFIHDDGSTVSETLDVLAEYEQNSSLYV